MDQKKQLGAVYTPYHLVKFIVDSVVSDLKDDVKIVDPACGTGNFLVYCATKLSQLLNKPIHKVIQDNIYGFDCDKVALYQCAKNLLSLCNYSTKYNLHLGNSINPDFCRGHFEKYDYVFGNPPYIRIQNLTEENKQYLATWQFGTGNSDLYIPFIELAFSLIKPTGKIGYITPNTFLKNRSQKGFLKHLVDNRLISHIIDFKHYQVFNDASTYSAVFFGDKLPKTHLSVSWPTQEGQCIDVKPYESVSPQTFALSSVNQRRIEYLQSKGQKLKDIAKIRVGLATLADSIFFLNNYKDEGRHIKVGKYRIEKRVLKPCVKVGRLKNEDDLKANTHWIIFPYTEDGKPLSEEQLSCFPGAYSYLLSKKKALLARDKGKLKYEWFLYGRNQGLTTLWGEKLLVPPIAKSPKFIYSSNPDLLFISGYCISEPKNTTLLDIKQHLESPDFEEYIHLISKDYQGGWKSVAKNMIQDFSLCLT